MAAVLSGLLEEQTLAFTAASAKAFDTQGSSSTSAEDERISEQDSLARCLLEQLLAPQGIAGGVVAWAPGDGGGERALVQHLDPSSMAALLRLQVGHEDVYGEPRFVDRAAGRSLRPSCMLDESGLSYIMIVSGLRNSE